MDHPRDPGGATNRGITRAVLAAWRGRPVTKAEVQALTVAEASEIYRARYWTPLRCDELPAGLDLMVFDFGVNAGVGRAARTLQRVVGAAEDGRIGPATVGMVRRGNAAAWIDRFADARLVFYRGLKTFATFGRGWTARVEDLRRRAQAMARAK